MSILDDIKYLARRYMNKQIDLDQWRMYTIEKIFHIETDEKAEDVARHFAMREEDDSNI